LGHREDSTLAVAVAGSMSAGVLLPSIGLALEPYLLVWLGALLFFNLLRLDTKGLVGTFSRPRQLAILSIAKLVGVPLGMYAITFLVYRPFALSVLLLSGISTGLGAPFVANIIGARLPLIVGMIVATSLAAPFVLPTLVYALEGSQFEIPIENMMILLAGALFVPLGIGWVVRKYLPRVSMFADRNSFSMSIIFVVLINFAMFAKISDYFYSQQAFLLQTIGTSFLCFGAFAIAGYYLVRSSSDTNDKAAGIISMTHVNNVLVTVFALQFFGSQVAALAALYNIPYYVGILPIKKIILHFKSKQDY
jgi:BASS family bile acid:Na+ symporter